MPTTLSSLQLSIAARLPSSFPTIYDLLGIKALSIWCCGVLIDTIKCTQNVKSGSVSLSAVIRSQFFFDLFRNEENPQRVPNHANRHHHKLQLPAFYLLCPLSSIFCSSNNKTTMETSHVQYLHGFEVVVYMCWREQLCLTGFCG